MHLASISWFLQDPSTLGTMGNDIHLLRGGAASQDLRPSVALIFETDPGDPATLKDQEITADKLGSNPTLAALLSPAKVVFSATFTLRPEHEITIDPDTGAVTAGIPTAADLAAAGGQINNFLLQAAVTPAGKTSPLTTLIRVQLHGQIDPTHVTLSPTGLTLRTAIDATRSNRFGVLAQFDDGVVGDVSLSPGLTWTLLQKDSGGNLVPVPVNPTSKDFELVEGGNVVVAMGANGFILANDDFVSDVFVKCSVSLNGTTSVDTQPGQVFSGGPWLDQNPLPVRFIDGDGVNNVANLPNVLILPDGFREEDKGVFEEMARRLVADIRSSRSAEPYRSFLVNRSMNYFSSFIASREFGCSVLYELNPLVPGALASPSPQPEVPPVTGATELGQLIYVVGLPIPADANLAVGDAITRWGKLYGDAFTTTVSASVLQGGLYARWTTLAGRTLAVEHDTALGMSYGLRTSAAFGSAQGVIGFNSFRAQASDLRARLSTVAAVLDNVGAQLPALWKAPQDPDTDTFPTHKDNARVIILCAGLPAAGTTRPAINMAAVGLGGIIRPIAVKEFTPPPSGPADGWNVLDVDPGTPTSQVEAAMLGTFLHEMSHGFACGDEYGGSDSPPDHTELGFTQAFGNIVLDSTLRGASPNQNDPFDMAHAFWGAAPRIRAAGILVKSPEKLGSQYRITLTPKQADPFKALGLKTGDPLFLRARPILPAITKLAPTGSTLQPPDFTLGISPQLSFQGFDSSGGSDDALLVTVAGGASLASTWNVPALIPPFNPILLAPTLGKSGTPLPLLSPVLAQYFATGGAVPMSRSPGLACVPESSLPLDKAQTIPAQQTVNNMPNAITNKVGIKFLSMVVGLYDGGAVTDCGVYHPTGYCAMRSSSQWVAFRPKPYPRLFRIGGTTEFCHVCRYLLIDVVDPTLHGFFDGLYDHLYVESAT